MGDLNRILDRRHSRIFLFNRATPRPLMLHIWFRDLIDSVEGKVIHSSRINPEFVVRFGSVPISKKLIQTSA